MSYQYLERESKSLEFKSKLPQFNQLVKTCVAFSNGTGGKIIIGVDDKTRTVTGVDDETRNRIYDEFPNSLYSLYDLKNAQRFWRRGALTKSLFA